MRVIIIIIIIIMHTLQQNLFSKMQFFKKLSTLKEPIGSLSLAEGPGILPQF